MLCDDVKASVGEGRRLYESIAKENVMIKVPATQAGYAIMGELARAKIHINATLIFSQEQAKQCAKVLDENLRGDARGVISVFVSRFDNVIDTSPQSHLIKSCFKQSFVQHLESLESHKNNVDSSLVCPALGVLNALACYDEIQRVNNPHIRTLFASTGAKLNGLNKDYYITNLIAPHSVNTAPLSTIEAFLDRANSANNSCVPIFGLQNANEALDFIAKLNLGGKDLSQIQKNLLDNGLQAFRDAFCEMLKGLE